MFAWLHAEGGLSEEEMARTFNCGLGAVLVASPSDAQRVLRQLQEEEEAWIVGSLTHKQPGETLRWFSTFFFFFKVQLVKFFFFFFIAGSESVVVRNLRRSLLNVGAAAAQNGTPRKRTRVGVLISGTGV